MHDLVSSRCDEREMWTSCCYFVCNGNRTTIDRVGVLLNDEIMKETRIIVKNMTTKEPWLLMQRRVTGFAFRDARVAD